MLAQHLNELNPRPRKRRLTNDLQAVVDWLTRMAAPGWIVAVALAMAIFAYALRQNVAISAAITACQ